MIHIPVLQKEVLEYLDPKPNKNFIDCTIGEGGHTAAILEKNGPNGKVLGIELDPEIYKKIETAETKNQRAKIKNRLIIVNDNYANLKKIVEKLNFKSVRGILIDLGMSSWHLEESKKGFSFLKNEPLDMRYSSKISNFKFPPISSRVLDGVGIISNELTAAEIINKWQEKEIERVLREYGEERYAKIIAKKITEARKIKPIKTTFQLVEIIKRAVPAIYQRQKIHFATRTFQALRISANNELDNLKKVLPQAAEILEKGDRMVIISFHSLEDRIIKNFFRDLSGTKLTILTKKPIRPTLEEIKNNVRARSAKLRAAEKIHPVK